MFANNKLVLSLNIHNRIDSQSRLVHTCTHEMWHWDIKCFIEEMDVSYEVSWWRVVHIVAGLQIIIACSLLYILHYLVLLINKM